MKDVLRAVARNYNPHTDAAAVEANLKHCGYYVEEQDNQNRLVRLLQFMPRSIIVATPEDSDEILGNMYIVYSHYPIIGRTCVAETVATPEAKYEVKRVLYNRAFKIARDEGAPFVEELFDWEKPRKELATAGPELSKAFGFGAIYDVYGMMRPLWDENGNPLPDIPAVLA